MLSEPAATAWAGCRCLPCSKRTQLQPLSLLSTTPSFLRATAPLRQRLSTACRTSKESGSLSVRASEDDNRPWRLRLAARAGHSPAPLILPLRPRLRHEPRCRPNLPVRLPYGSACSPCKTASNSKSKSKSQSNSKRNSNSKSPPSQSNSKSIHLQLARAGLFVHAPGHLSKAGGSTNHCKPKIAQSLSSSMKRLHLQCQPMKRLQQQQLQWHPPQSSLMPSAQPPARLHAAIFCGQCRKSCRRPGLLAPHRWQVLQPASARP